MSKLNKVCVNIDQTDPAAGGFTDTEKAQARANIGAGTGIGNSDINRYDISGKSYPVEELNIFQKSVGSSQLKDGATGLGSTVPTPSIVSDEGKVPVAYYRDGRGYFLLEKYKDDRFPDSTSANVGQVLTVDSHGVASWELPEHEIPVTGTNMQVLTMYNNEPRWDWAFQPLPGYNVSPRANRVQTWRPYFDVNYVVKFSYHAIPSMYADTAAHETEFNLANEQIRCKVSYLSKAVNDDYNSVRFQFKVNTGRELVIYGTFNDNMASSVPYSMNVFNSTLDDSYIGLYCTVVNDYIGLSHKTAQAAFAESFDLHLAWVNTKNFRMEDRIFITRFHNPNIQQSDNLVIFENYGTLTDSSV